MKRRCWADARQKIEDESRCRACARTDRGLETAHVIGRRVDKLVGSKHYVAPEDVIPLCRHCHEKYDQHRLNILPYLFLDEQVAAVQAAGGIEKARIRTMGHEQGISGT